MTLAILSNLYNLGNLAIFNNRLYSYVVAEV